jgi:hypothetical protein
MVENETINLKRSLTTNTMIANEFIRRFSDIMGQKLPEISEDDEEGADQIRCALEIIETSYA